MKITIIESAESVTTTGKKLKRLHLLVEGKQYPYKNVTAWSDSAPDYDKLTGGYKLEADIVEKPGTTINPKSGKPYINRTLYPLKENVQQSQNKTSLEERVAKLEEAVYGTNVSAEDVPF